MGREVRRVPADWEHPKGDRGHHKPLYDQSYRKAAAEWKEGFLKWEEGLYEGGTDGRTWVPHGKDEGYEYWDWAGSPPDEEYYRPEWPEETRTHLQMYETCSEGTPLSPVMETPEELARWLTDNKASAFADDTASYEAWLKVCRGASTVSAVMTVGEGGAKLQSGVEFQA